MNINKKYVITPKFYFYRNGGDGRDLYISSNQAGYYHKHFQLSNKHPNYFNFKKSSNLKYDKHFSPKIFRYYGSGQRENYILKNKDSLLKYDKTLKQKEIHYFNNFRIYNKKNVNKKYIAPLNKTQIIKTKKNIINKSIEILSKPKKKLKLKFEKDWNLLNPTRRKNYIKASRYFLI